MEKAIISHIINKNPTVLSDLGYLLFEKTSEKLPLEITHKDCIDFLSFHLLKAKSIIWDNLAIRFPEIKFEESPPELDHAGDVDYMAFVNEKAFGIQIKPMTAKSNFGNYSPSERMKASFADFEADFGGKVFIVFSLDGEIGNQSVIGDIRAEIKRLNTLT
jgi:hypothetical protein